MSSDGLSSPDFKTLFESAPGLYMVLDPELRIIAATDAYLQATLTRRNDILGRLVFDVFPDNPEDSSTTAVSNSTESFRRVLRERIADTMPLQRHDVRRPEAEGGGWETRYWSVINSPVLNADGLVACILHRVENVTGFVQLQQHGAEQSRLADMLSAQAAQMRNEIVERQRAEEALRHIEARSASVLEAAQLGAWDLDLVTKTAWRSLQHDKVFGYRELLPKWTYEMFLEHVLPEDRDEVDRKFQQAIAGGTDWQFECRIRRADGVVRWLWAQGRAHCNEEGKAVRMSGIMQDITHRKSVEEALRESEEQFRTLANAIPQLCWMANANGWIFWYNQRWYAYTGATPDQMEGWGWQSVHDPGELPGVLERWQASIATGEPFEMVFPLRGADGIFRPFLTRTVPVRDHEGKVVRWFGTNTDVSQQRQAEEALSRSERLYRAIGESIDFGIWVCAPDGRNTYVSESFLKLVGLTREQCSDFGWGDVLHPDDAERTIEAWKTCVRTEGRWDIEHRFRGVDGNWHPVLARGVPVRDEQGRIQCWAGINLDIAKLKQTEDSLRRVSDQRRLALEAAALGAWDYRLDTGEVLWDERCRDLFGFSSGQQVAYSAAIARIHSDDRAATDDAVKRAIAGENGGLYNREFRVVWPDGSLHWVASHGRVFFDGEGEQRRAVRFIGVNMDVTEAKRAEDRFRESQKLESLGLLAGGVAHDFNNLLVGVIGNASLAQEMLPPDHPALELLDGVLKTGGQAAHLTRQMLAYSGKGKFLVEPLDLSALIPEMTGLVSPSISKKVALRLDLDPELPPIVADRGQIQQVFMNLVLNAAEAIGSHSGTIDVRTGVRELNRQFMQLHPEATALRAGKHVYLEVQDTGCGMNESTKARIFDPFFSTKFTGRGLGLAAVAGILRGHGAAITMDSEPGQGSLFVVLFPVSNRATEAAASPARRGALRGAGVILVVDDESTVRDVAKRALERQGYTVLAAASGQEAIEISKKYPGEIALIILDLSMPRMTGEEVLPELRRIRPEVRIVVSSGYSESEAMKLFAGQKVSAFVQKPYTSVQLAEKVKRCLG
jgi:PAS domain S-box-containing protein